jgi:phosphoglycerol transferase MdoB-like AlkP superfamily enzyme
MATEAAVLGDTTALGAFSRSFELTPGRLERWLEMIVISVVMVLTVLFTCALFFLAFPHTSWSTWATVALFILPLVMSVIQYAWTFFYLRLEEADIPAVIDSMPPGGGGGAGPLVSGMPGTPRLKLVERRGPSEPYSD